MHSMERFAILYNICHYWVDRCTRRLGSVEGRGSSWSIGRTFLLVSEVGFIQFKQVFAQVMHAMHGELIRKLCSVNEWVRERKVWKTKLGYFFRIKRDSLFWRMLIWLLRAASIEYWVLVLLPTRPNSLLRGQSRPNSLLPSKSISTPHFSYIIYNWLI